MEMFTFKSEKIRTVARKTIATIAGISVLIAVNASATAIPNLSDMSMPDPLETVIANTQPGSTTSIDVSEWAALGRRMERLENSIAAHGRDYMNEDARQLWSKMISKAAGIPFEKVFVQFDDYSESFFFSFDFIEGYRMEATTYVDDDDSNVYFSVVEKGNVFFQNVLPREDFFLRSKSTYGKFAGFHA